MYHIARRQEDGDITSPMNPGFETLDALRKAAPNLLRGKRPFGNSQFCIIQVLEEITVTTSVSFQRLPASTRKKHGISRMPDIGEIT